MFAKLLKYEWKSSRGILGILSLAALGVGVLGTLILHTLVKNSTETTAGDETAMWLPAVLIIVLIFLILALVAYGVGSELLLLYRFYKSKFTDEGYLTFTLPVTSRQIFLASFLNMAIWMAIIGLVIMLSVGMMVLVSIVTSGVFNYVDYSEIRESFSMMLESLDGENLVWLSPIAGLVSFVYSLVMMMTSVSVGAVLAKKHKLLAAFGIYYGISMVSGILNSLLSMVMTFSASPSMNVLYLGQIGIQAVLAVGGFFLSTYLMEKKLNLP